MRPRKLMRIRIRTTQDKFLGALKDISNNPQNVAEASVEWIEQRLLPLPHFNVAAMKTKSVVLLMHTRAPTRTHTHTKMPWVPWQCSHAAITPCSGAPVLRCSGAPVIWGYGDMVGVRDG